MHQQGVSLSFFLSFLDVCPKFHIFRDKKTMSFMPIKHVSKVPHQLDIKRLRVNKYKQYFQFHETYFG